MRTKQVDLDSPEFQQAVLRAVAAHQAEHKVGTIVSIDHAYMAADRQHIGRWGVITGVAFQGGTTVFYEVNIGDRTIVAPRVTAQHPPR